MKILTYRTGVQKPFARSLRHNRAIQVAREILPLWMFAAAIGAVAVGLSMLARWLTRESVLADVIQASVMIAIIVPAGLVARRFLSWNGRDVE